MAVKKILGAIYEPRFLNCMYGFRPVSYTHLKDKAKLLILDEPTASLDPSSESEIYRRFLEKMDNQDVYKRQV